ISNASQFATIFIEQVGPLAHPPQAASLTSRLGRRLGPPASSPKGINDVQCFRCGAWGHSARFCRQAPVSRPPSSPTQPTRLTRTTAQPNPSAGLSTVQAAAWPAVPDPTSACSVTATIQPAPAPVGSGFAEGVGQAQ